MSAAGGRCADVSVASINWGRIRGASARKIIGVQG